MNTEDVMVCHRCGFENPPQSRFCGRCGMILAGSHHGGSPVHLPGRHPKKRKGDSGSGRRWHPATVAIGLVGACLVVVAGLQLIRDSQLPTPTVPLVEAKSPDPKVEQRVLAIASKFICSCGSCGEQPLETCACPTAVQERQFIRDAIQSGKDDGQITGAVDSTFGWLKRDSVAQTKKGTSENALQKGLLPPAPSTFPLADPVRASVTDKKVATSADRDEIFSHFRCPCGQCGVDDLKTCGCSHPRGAVEVKGYIDNRIAEGKATIVQLVNEVEGKYGHRIY